jgi:hypothetical protein
VKPQNARTAESSRAIPPLAILIALAIVLVFAYAALAVLSFRFGPGSEPTERPILLVLGLFGFTFLCYLIAIRVALRVREGTRLLAAILVTSVLIRAVALFSWPMLEIDINRYIWDGAVTLEGTSPYRYSPEQVLSGNSDGRLPEDLYRLVELRDEGKALGTILSRIHFSELPTIYPPLSQAVFALAVFVTPASASVFAHVLVMKTVFVLFDMATVLVVIGLLRLTGKHVGWSVAYGWCPLIIKEFANSGHLDSLAVFLTTLALYLAIRPLARGVQGRGGRVETVVAAVLFALAVGAKLYPIVLLLLFVMLWSRTQGWRWATIGATVFLATATIVLWPMIPVETAGIPPDAGRVVADGAVPPPPVDIANVEPQDPSGGLKAFLRRWEMNDFLFLLVVENLKPVGDVDRARRPWFSIVPDPWKATLLSISSPWLPVGETEAAFHLTRALTGSVFVFIVALLLWRVRSSGDPAAWLRVAFLTLAWFWLLSPTQNPWYWTWALPLVIFARSRVWLALSGLTMIYYLRFWLGYHWPEEALLGTPYAGEALFDLVVTWIEFGPWFLWLAWESRRRKSRSSSLDHAPRIG